MKDFALDDKFNNGSEHGVSIDDILAEFQPVLRSQGYYGEGDLPASSSPELSGAGEAGRSPSP